MSLDTLLGTWDFTMRHSLVPEPVTGRWRFARVLDGAYVQLDWTYDHPDFPDAIALLDGRGFHYFDVRGITRVFDLDVSDQGWSVVRRDPDFWQRGSATFVGADAMEGTWEISRDGGVTWEHDSSVSYLRVQAE